MELQITKEVFKSQAQKQLTALKNRGLTLKLSDIQESLAQVYGYANLATLYAKFKHEDYMVVNSKPFLAQEENLFVLTWFTPAEESDMCADEVLGIYPPGTTLDDLGLRNSRNLANVQRLNDEVLAIPAGMTFSKESITLENYAYVTSISKYGLDDAANESTVTNWAKKHLGFRVPTSGVEVCLHEMGDDTASKYHFLVWLNDADSAAVRAMFAK
jgi:hypothetical protein